MFEHLVMLAQQEAEDRAWQLRAAALPYLSKDDQRQTWELAKSLAEIGRRRKSALEMVDPSTRIEMIGCNLKLHGDRWARSHPEQMDWLRSAGVTAAEAIRRHEAWLEKTMSDPFWSR